jgi:hypothetical protein
LGQHGAVELLRPSQVLIDAIGHGEKAASTWLQYSIEFFDGYYVVLGCLLPILEVARVDAVVATDVLQRGDADHGVEKIVSKRQVSKIVEYI